jgi:hypothetical protein
MKPADVRARRCRLDQLSTGFRAELETVAKDPWPLYPVEAALYRKAIEEAKQAIERAHGALQHAADRMEEVKRRGR